MEQPQNPPIPEFIFYIYDHLGNTRVTYSTTHDGSAVVYMMEGAVDYFPYGKVLREYHNGEVEKYLSTQHERDQETGLDYRGARFYDADVGRFLSLDPKAVEYPDLSDYVYVFSNPTAFIDPDGKNGEMTINKKDGTIVVTVNLHFSTNTGAAISAATGKTNNMVSNTSFKDHLQENWKGTHSVDVDGKTYVVTYNINIVEHNTHEEAANAWKTDPASNFLYVKEDGRSSNYAADSGILELNARQQEKGDGKTYSHEVGHSLGLGHNSYKDKNGTYSLSSYRFGARNVIQQDVFNTVSNAVQLANQTEENIVNILLQTGNTENTVTIQNPNGTSGASSTYPVPDNQN